MTQIDDVVQNLERFYQLVTGREAPDPQQTYAPIPPEKNAEQWVSEQLERLLMMLDQPEAAMIAVAPPWAPAVTVLEASDHVAVRVDLPGVAREHVKVSLNQNVLTIEGVRPATTVSHVEYRIRVAEPGLGRFRRQLLVPTGLVDTELNAQMREGVLEVRLPRAVPPAAEARTVPVV
ncbi:Hsp20/alpha crystallin family protein [Myxococcota bacterium]|nr:Hsp20/alpha crystallin family protein [Myxococcota bacterium]